MVVKLHFQQLLLGFSVSSWYFRIILIYSFNNINILIINVFLSFFHWLNFYLQLLFASPILQKSSVPVPKYSDVIWQYFTMVLKYITSHRMTYHGTASYYLFIFYVDIFFISLRCIQTFQTMWTAMLRMNGFTAQQKAVLKKPSKLLLFLRLKRVFDVSRSMVIFTCWIWPEIIAPVSTLKCQLQCRHFFIWLKMLGKLFFLRRKMVIAENTVWCMQMLLQTC